MGILKSWNPVTRRWEPVIQGVKGDTGVGINDIDLDTDGTLTFTLTDTRTVNAGNVNAITVATDAKDVAVSKAAEAAGYRDQTQTLTDAAAVSKDAAYISEVNAKESETNSRVSETNTSRSESNSAVSEGNAKESEVNAKSSEVNSATSEANSLSYKNSAQTYASNAAGSASEAQGYANTASAKATEASGYATTASTNANTAQSLLTQTQSLLTQTQTVANQASSTVANLAPSAYSASTAYTVGQTVYYTDGYTYRCILASTGNAPTNATYWVKVATGLYSQTDLVNSNAYLKELAKSEYVRSAVMSGVLDYIATVKPSLGGSNKGEVQVPTSSAFSSQTNSIGVSPLTAVINGYLAVIATYNSPTYFYDYNRITLSTPPTSGTRDDLVFIEGYWVSKPAGASIYKYGQTGGTVERTTTVPETVFEWRLRVVSGVDFSTNTEGFGINPAGFAVQPQGTNASPLTSVSGANYQYAVFYNCQQRIAENSILGKKVALDDYGLYIAGDGSATSKTQLGTADGYSYAIPLFRIKRRNSAGYSASNPNGGRNYIVSNPIFSPSLLAPGSITQATVSSEMYAEILVGSKLTYTGNSNVKVLVMSKDGSNTITIKNLHYTVIGSNNPYYNSSDRPDGNYANIISESDVVDLRHLVKLTGNNYNSLAELNKTALDSKLLKTKDTTTLFREALTNYRRTKSNAQISETNTATVNPAKTAVLLPSTSEHKAYYTWNATSLTPSSPGSEFNSTYYAGVLSKDNTTHGNNSTTTGAFYQQLFSFDVTKLGGTRDAIVNSLSKLKFGWIGKAKGDNASVADYTASISFWTGSAWETATDVTTDATNIIPTELTKTATFTNFVDTNGKVWVLVKSKYPASATIASELYTDVASLTVELDKWAVGRTIDVTTTEGVLSGVIDADTGIATVVENSASGKTVNLKLNTIPSSIIVGDTVQLFRPSNPNAYTSAWYFTVNSIDNANNVINVTFSAASFAALAGDILLDITTSTSSPIITNSTATFSGLGTQKITATLTAVTDATKPIAITYSTNYPANQGLTYSATAVKDVTNADCGIEVKGRTLENKLGRDGNFEVDSNADGVADGWIGDLKGATATLETTSAKYGLKAQRITSTVGDTAGTRRVEKNNINIEANKYYLVIVGINTDGTALGYINIAPNTATGFSPINSSPSSVSKTNYIKFTSTTAGTVYFRCFNATAVGTVGWVQFDGARIYEIDQTTYNKIDVDPEYTGEKLAQKFPYVDSVQFKSNVLVDQKGKNLFDSSKAIDGFRVGTNGLLESLAGTTTSDYIPVRAGQLLINSNCGTNYRRFFYDTNRTAISRSFSVSNLSFTVNTDGYIRFTLDSGNMNIAQLEVGSTATTYEPYQSSLAHTPMQIASEESVWLMPNASVYKEVWRKGVVL